jgi:rubrerythrin
VLHIGQKARGKSPSVASLYRALAEAEEQDAQDEAQVIGPRRPVRARITGPGSGTDPELIERLERQVLSARFTHGNIHQELATVD